MLFADHLNKTYKKPMINIKYNRKYSDTRKQKQHMIYNKLQANA